MIRVGLRYFANLITRVIHQRGYLTAVFVISNFIITEIMKIPRMVRLLLSGELCARKARKNIVLYSNTILKNLSNLRVDIEQYHINLDAFNAHVSAYNYPYNYAAGPMAEGGMREQKLLEYFVSLDLLTIQSTDVVVDVGSEWSIFPEVLQRLSGAKVYRQDIIYPDGINLDHIGGNAATMPIPKEFFDKIVLHNFFEHFEGTGDTDFIREAWRVLKPGGKLCILPLFIGEQYSILTDPLVDRKGIVFDDDAEVIEWPWWHNRFGRIYDVDAFERRVLNPGIEFHTIIYHIENLQVINQLVYLHFVLIMEKPIRSSSIK
jgi:SAM-dependent methyltransferase